MVCNILDLHCDTITQSMLTYKSLSGGGLHFNLAELPKDWRWVQCMAIFIPDKYRGDEAEAYFNRAYAHYLKQLDEYKELLTPISSIDTIESSGVKTPFSCILTVEGGSVIKGNPENIPALYQKGVRMMTLTWNGANELCGGAHSNQGFTSAGRETVKRMEEVGMVVDVSHLSDKGFWELCEFSQRPFVASHSNSRAVCDVARNLTDDMFKEITARGGIVGINYYNDFIVKEGNSLDIQELVRHICHFLNLGGEDSISLGSDFDGAELPEYINSLPKVGNLITAMRVAAISQKQIDKILFGNAASFFKRYNDFNSI